MARARGVSWVADVRLPEGNRLRVVFRTEPEALAYEREVRSAVADGRPIPEPGTGMAGKRDLSTLGSVFDHVSRTRWAELKSAENAIRNGREVVAYFGRNRFVGDITGAEAEEFAADLAGRGKARATVNRKLAALSVLLKTARRAGVMDRLPELPWKKELKTRFRYLDDREETVFLRYWQAVGDLDMRDFARFLLDTGARAFSEAAPLSWDDCSGRVVSFWSTKANRPRSVPLTKRCREMLDRRKRERPGTRGPFQGIGKNTMKARWDRMRQALGFHDVTPHTLRHSCATRLVLGGADVKRVMEWLGHSSIETTLRYVQLKPSGLEDIVGILERREAA